MGKGERGGRWGQHWKHCHADNLEVFGIDKEEWTAAAKEGEGIPWHQGVLRGAEKFMTSWHEKQEGESHKRAIDQDKKEQQGNKETTTKPGGGVKGGTQRVEPVTAAEECKNEMADRIARYATD